MLVIDNVTYRIAGRPILEGASASLPAGRRIGLVGRNGAGKTTLLRLVLNEIEPDEGAIRRPEGWRIGTVAQEAPDGGASLIDTVLAADRERAQLLAAVEREGDAARLAQMHERLGAIAAWSAPARAAAILAGLGFPAAEQARPCSELSGGWRMRVALAAALFAAPDVLLLDEPTNYLDLEGVLWLEEFLRRYRGTVIVVSHDRDLLNSAVDLTLHLERGKLALYSGGYDTFARTRAERRAHDTALRAEQEKRRAHLQSFVDRFRYKKSKARQAQSRIKMLERLKEIVVLPDERAPAIRLPEPRPIQPPLITFDDASVGYVAGRPVLSKLRLRIDPDDRIALLGRNGNGKSTLAKLLVRKLEPMSGHAEYSRKLVPGYFAQHQLDELDGRLTPLETLARFRHGATEEALRTQLGGFGFSHDLALTPVSALSGGERARLMLAIATLDRPNLLVLDEPTNHLDIDARDSLLDALNDFAGAVVLISHDRRLIEGCVDRLVLVAEGRALPYDGDLDDYRRTLLVAEEGGASGSSVKEASRSSRRRSAAEQRLALKPLRDAAAAAEREMAARAGEIEEIDRALADPALFARDPAGGEKLAKRRAEAVKARAAAEARWLEASEKIEAAAKP